MPGQARSGLSADGVHRSHTRGDIRLAEALPSRAQQGRALFTHPREANKRPALAHRQLEAVKALGSFSKILKGLLSAPRSQRPVSHPRDDPKAQLRIIPTRQQVQSRAVLLARYIEPIANPSDIALEQHDLSLKLWLAQLPCKSLRVNQSFTEKVDRLVAPNRAFDTVDSTTHLLVQPEPELDRGTKYFLGPWFLPRHRNTPERQQRRALNLRRPLGTNPPYQSLRLIMMPEVDLHRHQEEDRTPWRM
jgi:hypothetical protein